jgi:hypothetical protein
MSIDLYDSTDTEVTGYPIELNPGSPYPVNYNSTYSSSTGYTPPSGGGTVGLNASADYNGSGCSGAATRPPGSKDAKAMDGTPTFKISEERPQKQSNNSYIVPLDILNLTAAAIKVHLVYSLYYRTSPDSPLVPLKYTNAMGDLRIFRKGTDQQVAAGPTDPNAAYTTADCHVNTSGAQTGSQVILIVHSRTKTYTPHRALFIEIENSHQP